jgi:hypothetical protein
MTRTVTTHYRYRRPPRKRKQVAIEAPAVVTAKSSRRPVWGKTAAEVLHAPTPARAGGTQPSTPRKAERVIAQPPATDDRKPAMATKPAIGHDRAEAAQRGGPPPTFQWSYRCPSSRPSATATTTSG